MTPIPPQPPLPHTGLFCDLVRPQWLYFKAALLFSIGLIASTLLLLDHPTFRTAAFLAAAIWGFCRAYYFAFYVIQHYADPNFRFGGLTSFLLYACRRKAHKGDIHN